VKRFLSLLNAPRATKRGIMVAADAVMLPLAFFTACILRLDEALWTTVGQAWFFFPLTVVFSLPVFLRLGLYHAVIRYLSEQAVYAIVAGVGTSVALLIVANTVTGQPILPYSLFAIYCLLALVYVGGSRFVVRAYYQWLVRGPKVKIIVYGAGASGAQTVAALMQGIEYLPVAFIDDNPALQGSRLHGITIYSSDYLPKLLARHNVQRIVLAIPSASAPQRAAILARLEKHHVHVLSIPGIRDLVSGEASINQLQDVGVEDLLGRDPAAPDPVLLPKCITDKSVLVTGAGGSIGSELCRQILMLQPTQLLLFDVSEYALYQIERELKAKLATHDLTVPVIALLGSVDDRPRLQAIMQAFAIQTVYHAAAYKHVPMVEQNVVSGVQNNILGTWHTAEAARAANVETFVLISTDKAVRPTNVMGATKRMAELVLQAMAQQTSNTRFCMVRFGNVLGSSGSIVPLFREQIKQGGPLTVTHPDVVRYFMTIPEAAQLVIQAGAMGDNGDVFVLDMGKPVKIADLAQQMIHLMGLVVKTNEYPEGDIAINYVGLRPGEKLYEELLIGNNVLGTQHPKIMRAQENAVTWEQLLQIIAELQTAIKSLDCQSIRQILLNYVNGYSPSVGLVDALWDKRSTHNASISTPSVLAKRSIGE